MDIHATGLTWICCCRRLILCCCCRSCCCCRAIWGWSAHNTLFAIREYVHVCGMCMFNVQVPWEMWHMQVSEALLAWRLVDALQWNIKGFSSCGLTAKWSAESHIVSPSTSLLYKASGTMNLETSVQFYTLNHSVYLTCNLTVFKLSLYSHSAW